MRRPGIIFALTFVFSGANPTFLLDAWAARPSHTEELARPFFSVTPSTMNLLQGQSLTLVVKPLSSYEGYNLMVSASLTGQALSVVQPDPLTWIVSAGAFSSVGTRNVEISLSLENSVSSARFSASIKRTNRRIMSLHAQIAKEHDSAVREALQRDLAGQQALLNHLQQQLLELRTPIGIQNFSFYVGPNSSDPAFPFVSAISPNLGAVAGGTELTIAGLNFAPGASVKIGGRAATNVNVVNSSTITAIVPPLSGLGSHDVEVFAPSSGNGPAPSSVLPAAFYALPQETPMPGNPPVAVTTGSQALLLGRSAEIDGSQSFDWGGSTLNFQWNLISTPASSSLQPGHSFPNATRVNFMPDVTGIYVVQLIVRPSWGGTVMSAPSLAVVIVTGPPAPTSPGIEVVSGGTATAQVSANDPSGVAVAYDIKTAPEHGVASVNATGLVTYTADSAYVGSDSVEINVSNQYGFSGTVVVPITVVSAFSKIESAK